MQIAVLFSAQALFSGLLKVGMLAAGMAISLLANQKIQQPIQDLKVSTSAYGRGLPRIYGTFRTTGNMFWSTDLNLVRKYIGPKGKQFSSTKGPKKVKSGKAQEVNTYYASFAMGLCVGPQGGVLRVWCDSNLIYDRYNPIGYYNSDGVWVPVVQTGFSQRPPVSGPGVTNMTKSDEKNQKKAPSPEPFAFVFYGGTEDQLADPTMVVASGVENTPAYRGVCYLMFSNFPLQDFGNRIPTITAEVTPTLDREVQIVFWPPLDTPPFADDNTSRLAALNPGTGQLYVQTDWDVGQYDVRTYDIYQQTEVNRFKNINNALMIGGSGDGKIVMQDVDNLLLFVSPSTGAVAYSVTVLNAAAVAPLLTVDTLGNTQLYTIVTSILGPSVVLDNTGRQVGSVGSAGINTKVFQGAPGTRQNVLIVAAEGVNVWASSAVPFDTFELFFSVPDHGGTTTLGAPIYSMNADAYLITYQSSGTGLSYAAGFDTAGNLLWEQQIGATVTGFTPIPVLQGLVFKYLWSSADSTNLVSINVKTGAWTEETLPFWDAAGGVPLVNGQQYYDEGADAFIYYSANAIQAGPGWYKVYVNRYKQVSANVADVVTDVMGQVGVDTPQIDVSALNDDLLVGYSVENITTARKVIEDLAQLFMFDVTESDNTLKVVSRGQDPITTIYESSLGLVGQESSDGKDSDGSNHKYEETRIQEVDLPLRVDISFIDPVREYEAGTTGYARPSSPNPVMQSKNLMQVNLPIALTEDQAQQWAETICNAAWLERVNHKLVLPPEFLVYDPTDVVFVSMDDGLTFCDRLTRIDIGGNFVITAESVSQTEPYYLVPGVAPVVEDLYSPYEPVGVGFNPGGVVPTAPRPAPMAQPLLMDIPLTEDSDANKSGGNIPLYWGAGAWGPGFTGGQLQILPTGGQWTPEGGTSFEAVWGISPGLIPDAPEGVWATDRKTAIQLSPEYDYEADGVYEWTSITDDAWPSYRNMILIGKEIICFKTATVNPNHTVTLTTLMRGQRGTENECAYHQPNERFVLLNTGDQMASVATADVGVTVAGRLSTNSILSAISPSDVILFKGNSLRPYAPTQIERNDDAAGDSVITWLRRTRYNGFLMDSIGTVPLNEDQELYRIYISAIAITPNTFDPTAVPAQFIREVDGLTVSTFAYTAAMKVLDGISFVDRFWVAIYEISGEVGLGFPGISQLHSLPTSDTSVIVPTSAGGLGLANAQASALGIGGATGAVGGRGQASGQASVVGIGGAVGAVGGRGAAVSQSSVAGIGGQITTGGGGGGDWVLIPTDSFFTEAGISWGTLTATTTYGLLHNASTGQYRFEVRNGDNYQSTTGGFSDFPYTMRGDVYGPTFPFNTDVTFKFNVMLSGANNPPTNQWCILPQIHCDNNLSPGGSPPLAVDIRPDGAGGAKMQFDLNGRHAGDTVNTYTNIGSVPFLFDTLYAVEMTFRDAQGQNTGAVTIKVNGVTVITYTGYTGYVQAVAEDYPMWGVYTGGNGGNATELPLAGQDYIATYSGLSFGVASGAVPAFYISPSGNDTTGDGTKAKPYLSTTKINAAMSASLTKKTAYFMAGTHNVSAWPMSDSDVWAADPDDPPFSATIHTTTPNLGAMGVDNITIRGLRLNGTGSVTGFILLFVDCGNLVIESNDADATGYQGWIEVYRPGGGLMIQGNNHVADTWNSAGGVFPINIVLNDGVAYNDPLGYTIRDNKGTGGTFPAQIENQGFNAIWAFWHFDRNNFTEWGDDASNIGNEGCSWVGSNNPANHSNTCTGNILHRKAGTFIAVGIEASMAGCTYDDNDILADYGFSIGACPNSLFNNNTAVVTVMMFSNAGPTYTGTSIEIRTNIRNGATLTGAGTPTNLSPLPSATGLPINPPSAVFAG